MVMSSRLKEFLNNEGVQYEELEHPESFTALETAGAQHVPGANLIKAVIVICDEQPAMCVLSAIHLVDVDKFREVSGAKQVSLATEEKMAELFPDYELGAEPPFGRLYGLSVFVDSTLEGESYVCFKAGTHTGLVKMSFDDYLGLAKPVTIGDFGKHI